jgi:hypothetical protein
VRHAIGEMAAEQAGAISLEQIRRLGVSESQLRTLRRRGHLIAIAPRVFAVAGAPPTVDQRLHAGLLCLGHRAAVSHEAAAHLHGLEGGPPDAVEFAIVRSSRGRAVPFIVHTTSAWGRRDLVTVDGLRCTAATRTILDLASAGSSRPRLEQAIDSAVRLGLSSPTVLAEQLAGRPGWRGVRSLRALLPDSGGHSWLERRFLTLVRRCGLPRPDTQTVHRRGGRTAARTDFCWRGPRLVVEVSGRRGHASDRERERDAHRRNELQELGWRVFEFTYRQIEEQPAEVAATMRRLLTDVR